MQGFIIRLVIAMAGLWVAQALLDGIWVDRPLSLLWSALVLGLVNALVRPLVILLTLPATLLSLGLFLLVINAAMLGLAAWIVPGLHVAGFGSALLGAIIISLVSMIGAWLTKDQHKPQISQR
jgi:putative membrane protein